MEKHCDGDLLYEPRPILPPPAPSSPPLPCLDNSGGYGLEKAVGTWDRQQYSALFVLELFLLASYCKLYFYVYFCNNKKIRHVEVALILMIYNILNLHPCPGIVEWWQTVSSGEEKTLEWILVKTCDFRHGQNGGRARKLLTVTWKMGLTRPNKVFPLPKTPKMWKHAWKEGFTGTHTAENGIYDKL